MPQDGQATAPATTDTNQQATNTQAGAANTAPATNTAPAAQPYDFAAAVGDEYKEILENKGWKEPKDVLKSYVNLEKVMGNPLVMPSEDATKEDWDRFYNRLGRPEKPDAYQFEFPEGYEADPEFLDAYRAKAHELGLTVKQAKTLLEDFSNRSAQRLMQEQEAAAAENKKEWDALQSEWGTAFEQRIDVAKRAVKALGGDSLQSIIDEMESKSSTAAVVRFMFEVGKRMSEHNGNIGINTESGFGTTPAAAQKEINEIYQNPLYMNPDKNPQEYARLQSRITELFKIAYPS